MKPGQLIAASAIFFFLWATMAVTLTTGGAVGSRTAVFALSLISLAGSVEFLRAMRRESPRWRRGIPFVAVCAALVLWTGMVAWVVPYHIRDPAFQMMFLLPPAAALLLSSFPDGCRDRVRLPAIVVAVLGIVSLFLAFNAFLKIIPSPRARTGRHGVCRTSLCPPPHAPRRAAAHRDGGDLPMKFVALVALLALAWTAGCIGTAADPPPADDIAARFIATEERTEEFTATVAVTAGSESVTARLLRKGPDCYRLEYLKPADLAGTVTLSNGTRKWRYDPAGQAALTVAGPYIQASFSEPPYPGWAEEVRGYTETVAESLAEQNASYRGTEDVGGRTAYILEVADDAKLFEAPTRYREAVHRLRVWIDAETWLLLGLEMYGNEGSLFLSAEYTDPSANTGLPDDLFVFDPPAGTVIRPMPTAAITPLFLSSIDGARRCGAEMPSYLPEGYAFADGVHLPGGYTVLRFTNGTGELEVVKRLYDPYREEKVLPGTPEPVLLSGDREAEYVPSVGRDQLRWSAGGYSYQLTGGMLGKDELVRVAESVAV